MHDCGDPKIFSIFGESGAPPEYFLLKRGFGTRIEGYAREIGSALTRARVYYIRSIGLSNNVFGNPHGCIYISDGKTNLT